VTTGHWVGDPPPYAPHYTYWPHPYLAPPPYQQPTFAPLPLSEDDVRKIIGEEMEKALEKFRVAREPSPNWVPIEPPFTTGPFDGTTIVMTATSNERTAQ
jgi:hypothetical protein